MSRTWSRAPCPQESPTGRWTPGAGSGLRERGSAGRKSEQWPGGGGSGGGLGTSPGCLCVGGRPGAHPHGAEAASPVLSARLLWDQRVGVRGGRPGQGCRDPGGFNTRVPAWAPGSSLDLCWPPSGRPAFLASAHSQREKGGGLLGAQPTHASQSPFGAGLHEDDQGPSTDAQQQAGR